ncbi:hypothetical protein WJX81_003675 [Elliptochloris bilobata]|uniref:Membrane transporter protein n=1 Tax=Elliptochloris bilobata TaxID=381761 RepID=A0AAW1R305_9CHLO
MGVGEFLGNIVRGVTGFGSAVVLVSVWIIATTLGINAGPFVKVIFADSLAGLFNAVPLLLATKPWYYSSWRLVFTIIGFQALGAPIGAYLVIHLEPHKTQLCIAVALTVVFFLMAFKPAKLVKQWRAKHAPDKSSEDGGGRAADPLLTPTSARQARTFGHGGAATFVGADAAHCAAVEDPSTKADELRQGADAGGSAGAGEDSLARLASAQDRQARGWRVSTPLLIGVGATAATCSGCLSALAGIGGPPIILMYELLRVPQAVVRATSTTTNLVSIKFLTYLAMGAATWDDLPLYLVAITCSVTGLQAGAWLAGRLNREAFSRMLLGILLLSTCLLYASAFGLTGH